MTENVLFVDDNEELLRGIQRQLRNEPFGVLHAHDGEQALDILGQGDVAVLVVDELMPGMRGSELLKIVADHYPHIVSIMLTGNPSLSLATTLLNQQMAYRFLVKPYRITELKSTLEEAFERSAMSRMCTKVIEGFERRSGELRRLERTYPGITKLNRDAEGAFILDDTGGEDVKALVEVLETPSLSDEEE